MKDKDNWRHNEEKDNCRHFVVRITGDMMKDKDNCGHKERDY
jgi:hypothetical protein